MLQIFNNFIYFLKLSIQPEVLWTIFPLGIATIVMLIYFEKYHTENPGWNTYVANSLVLLFVSTTLFRYIFQINNNGAQNFLLYPYKFGVASTTLVLGITLLFLDFGHFLPEKIAKIMNSPLSLNIFCYTLIIFVYSKLPNHWSIIISLFLLFITVINIINTIRKPIQKLFKILHQMKKKEEIEKVIETKKQIIEEEKELRKKEKKIKQTELKKIKEEEKELRKVKNIVKKF